VGPSVVGAVILLLLLSIVIRKKWKRPLSNDPQSLGNGEMQGVRLITGIYTVTNVKHRNLAILPDANDGSDVVARPEDNKAGEKVCRLSLQEPIQKHDLSVNPVECRTA
jgi:hypothetical protein